ncbi:MAG: preprotein translocase subunit YajC [Alistipes sp.]|nr:preprotein translocase subunit YajC [Alistipes sp.]
MQAAQGADGAAKTGGLFGGSSGMIIMMVLIFAVMWLLMIRPQQKQQKELAKFRNSLERGAKVVTAGGIHGTVKEVNPTTVVIEIDKNVSIEVDKTMIMRAPGA